MSNKELAILQKNGEHDVSDIFGTVFDDFDGKKMAIFGFNDFK
jgi:hypothetical protein